MNFLKRFAKRMFLKRLQYVFSGRHSISNATIHLYTSRLESLRLIDAVTLEWWFLSKVATVLPSACGHIDLELVLRRPDNAITDFNRYKIA
jgi:hypothetical protein